VTAHAAFGRLAARYGLRQEAIAGIDPEQDPDPRRLAQLTDLVRRDGVTTVFTEELVSPRVADTLAREAGVSTKVLSPIESPPRGKTGFAAYAGAMRRNLAALRGALGCR
jgi:zinc transport system substrate-binding protein